VPRQLAAFGAAVAILDGLAVLTFSLILVPADARAAALLGGTAVLAVGGALAAMLASGVQRLWLTPLRQLVASLDQDALAAYAGAGMPEVTVLDNAVRRYQERMLTQLDESQREHTELVAIFNQMADGVLVLGSDERVVLSNPASARLLGRQVLLDRPLPEVARDPDLIQIARAASSGTVVQLVELWPEAGGARRWLQVVATRLPPGQRRLMLLQNVTELRHAEAARRDFVANVSHELRTPVASLTALVETLEGGARDDPRARTEFLRRMHIEVDRLAHLVAELLQLARVEAGRIELDLEVHDADDLLQDAVDRIQPYAERVGLTVRLDSRHQPGARVCADNHRVGQVLANLLNNAVKFTPPGGLVQVGGCVQDDLVELWVTDSGVGIEPDQLLRIFERFYKIDASRAGHGTGLGLAICKHLVQAHGGKVWAESPGSGRGATFRFTLPVGHERSATKRSIGAKR
jgi:two-component system, OmpR family, phosphate regulon sensor histidine kinase PhoR